jgi:hypothetical protein
MRYFYVDTWGAWRKVIQEDSKELTRYTLADFGLTNASFAGKTWEQCALIIVNACPASRVIQYISPHTENYENIAIALSNEGLHNLGTLRFEAGKESLNRDIPNKFEYNGNNGNGIFVGFYDNVWRGWRRLDTGEVQETGHFTLGLKHMNCFVRVRSANPVTITVPNNVIFPPRTEITIMQEWSGQLTLVPASGVDLYIENNCRKSDGLRTAFTLHQTWTNKWFGVGRFAS